MNAALITGGSKRIGRGIAMQIASLGYDVAIHYNKSQKEAIETRDQIRKSKIKCEIFHCDLKEEREVKNLIPKVLKKFPDLNLLVNSASIYEQASILKTTPNILDDHLKTNFIAPFILSRDFASLSKGGLIINILDTRIRSNSGLYAAYSLSKKLLAEFTRMSALEFAPKVRVNAIAPGLILPPKGKDISYLDRLAKGIPLKRKGSIDNIKESVKFLIENDFIAGQIIFCDGGQHLNY